MSKSSVPQATPAPTPNSEERPIELLLDRLEAELSRLTHARPELEDRAARAAHILVSHVACRKERVIRARVRGSELVGYLVKGSRGATYVVDPRSWRCSCPDHHRRDSACKHAIACYVLWRAAGPAKPRNNPRACEGCGDQFDVRAMVEVMPGHECLTFFPGDWLCLKCGRDHGVL